jgi:type II secretory pathway pseudopilin PulG
MAVIAVIVGILAALSVPNLLGLFNRQQLNTAQADALQAIQQAQTNARKQQDTWQISFRDSGGKVEWAVHRPGVTPAWNQLSNNGSKFTIITTNPYTNFNLDGSIYRIQFGRNATVQKNLVSPAATLTAAAPQRITFALRGASNSPKRCVTITTILGGIGTYGEDSSTDIACRN